MHSAHGALPAVESNVALCDHGLEACVANSFWQKPRAKKPRSSSRCSSSMMNAPSSFVSMNFICRPPLPVSSGPRAACRGSSRHRLVMPEVFVEDPILEQLLDVADT